MRGTSFVVLTAAAMSLVLAQGAGAGQVFVLVNSPSTFQNGLVINGDVPALNVGDHVIWRWIGNDHTVTSGNPGNGSKNNIFDSSPSGTTYRIGRFFSWKTTGTGPVSYFSIPDRQAGMKGRVVFPVPNTTEADLRITEVRFDGQGLNFIEIANLGNAPGDLAGFRLCINGTATTLASQVLNPLQRVSFPNPAGLSNAGSVALYAPNSISNSIPGNSSLNSVSMLVDYVEWGASAGQPLENIAIQTDIPKLWIAGDFAPQAATGHSIVFCGTRGQYGRTYWNESTHPTEAAINDCVSPVVPATWGRLKTLYR